MSARARARVTIEFDLPGGGWRDECSVGQVWRQAEATARECVMRGFVVGNLTIEPRAGKVAATILGEPLIEMIVVEGKF